MLKLLLLLVRNRRCSCTSRSVLKDATTTGSSVPVVRSKKGQQLSSYDNNKIINKNNNNGVLMYWLERFGWYTNNYNIYNFHYNNSLQVQLLDGTCIGLDASYNNNNSNDENENDNNNALNESIYFAVPKSKITRSKKRMKTTTQKAIKYKHNIVTDPLTNEISLQHKLPINWKEYINFDMFQNTTSSNDSADNEDNDGMNNNNWMIGKPVTWTKNFTSTAPNKKKKKIKSDFIVDNRSTTAEEKLQQEQQKRQQSGQKLLE